jgi:hypothetical protein
VFTEHSPDFHTEHRLNTVQASVSSTHPTPTINREESQKMVLTVAHDKPPPFVARLACEKVYIKNQ